MQETLLEFINAKVPLKEFRKRDCKLADKVMSAINPHVIRRPRRCIRESDQAVIIYLRFGSLIDC